MEYHDRVLKCSECSAEFVFTAGEQMFFADKGFKNEPKRCKACKARRAEGGGPGSQRRFADAFGDQDQLLAVRQGDYRSFSANAGTAGILPGMLPAAAVDGRGLVSAVLGTRSNQAGTARDSVPIRCYPADHCANYPNHFR